MERIRYMYDSPRQKYFKHKLQLRYAYHMILDQNELTKIFFGHFGRPKKTKMLCLACPTWFSGRAGQAEHFRFFGPAKMAKKIFGESTMVQDHVVGRT